MKRLFQLLVVNAVRDILRYKSFILLIFFLMLVDKLAKKYKPRLSELIEKPEVGKQLSVLSDYLYQSFPSQLQTVLFDYRTLLVLVAGFFLKALISLWPSSDMRRMHRGERKGFGIFAALFSLRSKQLVMDLFGVSLICLTGCLFMAIAYGIGYLFWKQGFAMIAAEIVLLGGFLYWPFSVAGFSYSAKVAVLSKGSYRQKIDVFLRLYSNMRTFLFSWFFYGFRIYLEVFVLAVIPVLISLYLDLWLARILLISLIACPIYALLKMISFKVFLYLFKEEELVRQEYGIYYREQVDENRAKPI